MESEPLKEENDELLEEINETSKQNSKILLNKLIQRVNLEIKNKTHSIIKNE